MSPRARVLTVRLATAALAASPLLLVATPADAQPAAPEGAEGGLSSPSTRSTETAALPGTLPTSMQSSLPAGPVGVHVPSAERHAPMTSERPAGSAALVRSSERRFAVWTEPVFTTIALLLPGAARTLILDLGLNVSLARGLDLVIAGGFTARVASSAGSVGLSGSAELGVAILLSGERRLNGLFIAPKLRVGYGNPLQTSYTTALDLALVLDVGYQLTVGAFFVAPVVGFGPGVQIPLDGGGSPRYTATLNIALLRMGVAF